MGSYGLHIRIKDTHHSTIPSSPDLLADILGGHFIVSAFDFNVAVAMYAAPTFFKTAEQALWQGLQSALFGGFKVCVNLPFGCAVDALVSDVGNPPSKVFVDLYKALKLLAFQSVVFDVFDRRFNFSLVGRPGKVWRA